MSTTVTSSPRLRAVAATSQPMKPAPTTTSREGGAQRQRVLEVAQHVHAVELQRVLARPVARTRAGGDQQLAVAQGLPTGQRELVVLVVKVRRPLAQPPDDVEITPGQRGLLGFLLAGQQLLGQRRARVREVLLLPHDDHVAVVLGAPDRLRGAQPGQRCPDDDDRVGQSSTRIAAIGQTSAASCASSRWDGSMSSFQRRTSSSPSSKMSGATYVHSPWL
jgi:hypothetical protein